METTKLQLNASLRFNAAGELIGRDLLINFREQTVADCVKLLGDFNRQFNLNLGLPEQAAQVKTQRENQILPSGTPTQCPNCLASLIRRKVSNKESKSYGKEFLGCSNYYRKGCLFTHWL